MLLPSRKSGSHSRPAPHQPRNASVSIRVYPWFQNKHHRDFAHPLQSIQEPSLQPQMDADFHGYIAASNRICGHPWFIRGLNN